jgi:hypothetical protein
MCEVLVLDIADAQPSWYSVLDPEIYTGVLRVQCLVALGPARTLLVRRFLYGRDGGTEQPFALLCLVIRACFR